MKTHILCGIKMIIAYIISCFIKVLKKEEVWLIGERKGEAKDNGYHLFKYIRTKFPEEKIYYVIEKSSKDVEKLKKLGNVIYYGSFLHYIYIFLADKLICAHMGSCVYDSPVMWLYIRKVNKIRIFIQHGITKEKIPSLMFKQSKVKLFICGAKPEYDYIIKEYGYPNDNVIYAGFSRYDNLLKFKLKKQILIMPTWRSWFGMTDLKNSKNSENFRNSEYFEKYNSLLNNGDLINFLEEKNIQLIFYPHQEMQRYIKEFQALKTNKIIIANSNEYDVQELLKESEILITDYSSVAFDFAYMRKSLLYYQFDEEKYYKEHYSKGYFDYGKNGFGPVLTNEKDLIETLKEIVVGNIKNDIYSKRIKEFFPLYDNNNSLRIYEAIKKL